MMLRLNVSVRDQSSYFTSLLASFSSSQAQGWLTDLELVGSTGTGWGSVLVHKALILPLCPYLTMMPVEDPKIIFTCVPLEVIRSTVKLIYTGACTLSPVSDVKTILDLLSTMGLYIQPDRLQVLDCANNELSIVPQGDEFEELGLTREGEHFLNTTPVIVSDESHGGIGDGFEVPTLQHLVLHPDVVKDDDWQTGAVAVPILSAVKLNLVLQSIDGAKRRCWLCVGSCSTKKEKKNVCKQTTQCQVCCRAVCKTHRVQICQICPGLS